MDGIIPVGAVPDEVLLLCGQPDSMPSAWWTPTLVESDDAQVEAALGAARDLLGDLDVRDPVTGELRGLLGGVAAVVAAAELVVLLDADDDDRRALVVAPEAAILDRQVDGIHQLLLASPSAAVQLLAALLWTAVEPSGDVIALAGRRTPDEVVAVLPPSERTTTRITRTTVGEGVHLVTVLAHSEGAVACVALPEGDVHVQVLDETGAADLALVLLGADTAPVVA